MRRMTYAEAAAGAVSCSSDVLQLQQQLQQQQQQLSTGTSPSLCSEASSREGDEWKLGASGMDAQGVCMPPTEPGATAPMGANPGTVKLLKDHFERQSSDSSLSSLPRVRLPAAAPEAAIAIAAAAAAAVPAAERGSTTDDVRHWELLSDARACAEVIQQLLQEKQQLQQQVDSLWSQKEAFRCANERISRMLLRQQQQQPAASLAAAADAAGATPRKDLSRRSVTVVPDGCLTARAPRGPRMGVGASSHVPETPPLDFTAIKEQQRQLLLQRPRPEQQKQQQPQPPQQKKKTVGIPGLSPLNLGALGRPAGGPSRAPLATAGVSFWEAPCGGPLERPRMGGALTCRASLASSALKTPRRRFGDGGISARGAAGGWQRRGWGEQQQEQQQHAAIEEALVASMRSMNMLTTLGLGSGSSRKSSRAAAAAALEGKWEPTPEAALVRCSSNPDRGYWHSTFLCVLKVEGTDFFLDAVQQQQPQLRASQRSGSSFFSTISTLDEAGGSHAMSGARIVATKETAGET